jgi:hypothetical protein
MWQLQLSRHRRARVWFGEAPNAGYSPTAVVRRVVSTGDTKPAAAKLAAIELMVPRGAIATYGLLGAELLDDGEGVGAVCVGVNRTGFPMQQSLAPMSDDVRVGLLDEYAEAVVSGVERVVNEGWHFKGELTFRWAAHSAVGSSPAFFLELSVWVARLLAGTMPPSEKNLVDMLA